MFFNTPSFDGDPRFGVSVPGSRRRDDVLGQHLGQNVHVNGFRHMVVHAHGQGAVPVLRKGVSRHGNDEDLRFQGVVLRQKDTCSLK